MGLGKRFVSCEGGPGPAIHHEKPTGPGVAEARRVLVKKAFFGVAGALMLAAAVPASATVTVCTGSGQQCAPQTDTNVLLTPGTNLTTVRANFNGGSGLGGTFTSLTDALNAEGSGQATVTATTGLINQLTFTASGSTFTTATFNLSGSATDVFIEGLRSDGTAFSNPLDPYTISQGSNFFGIVATGGDVLTGFRVQSTTGFTDLRHLRLSGLAVAPGAVPEPATWAMMLIGFGGMGVALRRRRRQTNTLFQAA